MPPANTLYAMYVQATKLNPETGKTLRNQWVVLPPLVESERFGVEFVPRNEFLVFTRAQLSLENRVKWRYYWDVEGKLLETLPAIIAELGDYTVSPIITAQVTVPELRQLQRSPTTPYVLLRRFEKVASKVHGLSI